MQPGGVPVDWETGEPDGPRKVSNRAEIERNRALESVNRATDLRSALADPEGHAVVTMVTDRLADRLEYLALHDPECLAYRQILTDLNRTLELGARASEALMGNHLREAQRGYPTGGRA